MEEWKTITEKGIDIEVSDKGRIRIPSRDTSYTRIRNGKEQFISRKTKPVIISAQPHHTGYREIGFRIDGKRYRFLLHRLVAIAFVDGYKDGLCVNHINGVKTDNRPENLEWVSLSRNTEHAWEIGLVDLKGENQPTHKLTSRQVVYIRRLLNIGISAHALSVIAGVSDATIHMIKHGRNWKSLDKDIENETTK